MPQSQPEITLIGRTSAWQWRTTTHSLRRAPDQQASVLATWVHHRSIGTIGVFLRNPNEIRGIRLERNQWCTIAAIVHPVTVFALADDPRSAYTPDQAPLFLEIVGITHIEHGEAGRYQAQLTAPQHVRVASTRQQHLAQTYWPDAVYWQRDQPIRAVCCTWNSVRGVISTLGGQRYLRYVLSYES